MTDLFSTGHYSMNKACENPYSYGIGVYHGH